MNRSIIFPLLVTLLMAGCMAVPTQQAEERATRVQSAVVNAVEASVAVVRFSDDAVLATFFMPEEDAAVLKDLLGQGRPSVYEPVFVSPPAPPFVQTYLCIGAFKLNLEDIWSESSEASYLEWLRKCDGEGRLRPQIVLPDAAYARLMALDAIRQAREATTRLENEAR